MYVYMIFQKMLAGAAMDTSEEIFVDQFFSVTE